MFSNFSNNIGKVFDKISGKKFIGEDDLNETLREIRVALLEADVSLKVAKDFINKVKEKALGEQVLKSVSAGQMIVKIVNDCLVELLGSEKSDLNIDVKPPAVILMAGLQGAGKTTSAAKIALKLRTKYNKKVLVASLDAYRPAAKEQLEIMAQKAEVDSLKIIQDEQPLEGCKRALKKAKDFGYDVLILDSAGRTAIDEKMMAEVVEIKKLSQADETLLTVDAMIGQDAINVATNFHEKLGVTGIVLTRLDGDSRGGVALTMREVTGCAIKFIGVGEGIADFEEFDPARIASRIVGMGDMVSLVEKAQEVLDEKEMEKAQKKLKKGTFDLEDLLSQIRNMKKMGGMGGIMKFIPGMSKLGGGHLDKLEQAQDDFKRQEALILSMTKKERQKPDILSSSRKRRIAAGAGSTIQEVNRLLKKYKQMQKMMKKVGKFDQSELESMAQDENMDLSKLMGGAGGGNTPPFGPGGFKGF